MQTLSDTIQALTAYRAQLEEIAAIEAQTLAATTELAAVRSQLTGIREMTSGLSITQYRTLADYDERIFKLRAEIEELEIAIPKKQAQLQSYTAVNVVTKAKHDTMENNILNFKKSLSETAGGGGDVA